MPDGEHISKGQLDPLNPHTRLLWKMRFNDPKRVNEILTEPNVRRTMSFRDPIRVSESLTQNESMITEPKRLSDPSHQTSADDEFQRLKMSP